MTVADCYKSAITAMTRSRWLSEMRHTLPGLATSPVAYKCYVRGMRRRVSTTVDGDLLDQARGLQAWANDAAMMDAALEALASRHREAEIDAAYAAYDRIPMNAPDEWGDLESFVTAKWGDPPGHDDLDADQAAL